MPAICLRPLQHLNEVVAVQDARYDQLVTRPKKAKTIVYTPCINTTNLKFKPHSYGIAVSN